MALNKETKKVMALCLLIGIGIGFVSGVLFAANRCVVKVTHYAGFNETGFPNITISGADYELLNSSNNFGEAELP